MPSKSAERYWYKRVVRQAALGATPFYKAFIPHQTVIQAEAAKLGYECIPVVYFIGTDSTSVDVRYPVCGEALSHTCNFSVAKDIAHEYGVTAYASVEGLNMRLPESEFKRLEYSVKELTQALLFKNLSELTGSKELYEAGIEFKEYAISSGNFNADYIDVYWHGESIDLCLEYRYNRATNCAESHDRLIYLFDEFYGRR